MATITNDATDSASATSSDAIPTRTYPEWRGKESKLKLGAAASADSDMFKSPGCFAKPKAMMWDHKLSKEAKLRVPNLLKGAAKHLRTPGIISLGGGLPSSEYFPLDQVSLKAPIPPYFSEEETRKYGRVISAGKHDIRDGTSSYDLSVALNYGQAMGSGQLLRFTTEHTEIVHNPPYADWHCCLTAGSTSGWEATLRLLCERGDYILTEEYTFATSLLNSAAMEIKAVPIKMDSEGLLAEHLDTVLNEWDEKTRGARKPSVLYTIPSGQNPTGATQSIERRREIYRVASKHDVIIVEDEPYYFLQMQPYSDKDSSATPTPANHVEFLSSLVPSYLSIDVEGRVVRLESFSKVIAPGSRVGWVVAPQQVIERYIRYFEVSTQNPSGIAQIVLYKLLEDHWGHKGYLEWLLNLRLQYTNRRDAMLHACERCLPSCVASWRAPDAGMFHWIKINWRNHPSWATGKTHREIEESIFQTAVAHGVLVSCGSWFTADRNSVQDNMYFRTTFAAAHLDEIEEAIGRFGDAIRAEFNL